MLRHVLHIGIALAAICTLAGTPIPAAAPPEDPSFGEDIQDST